MKRNCHPIVPMTPGKMRRHAVRQRESLTSAPIC
jgi:hypothetical protein